MLKIITLVFVIVIIVTADDYINSDEEYVDSVISLLLNGNNDISVENPEVVDEPVFIEGVWKCGNCENMDENKLIYSEVNDVDANDINDQSFDIQIGLGMNDMQCITVTADVKGVVRRVSGACAGTDVTLNIALAKHITVQVYGK